MKKVHFANHKNEYFTFSALNTHLLNVKILFLQWSSIGIHILKSDIKTLKALKDRRTVGFQQTVTLLLDFVY